MSTTTPDPSTAATVAVVGLGGMGTTHAANLADAGARIAGGADPDGDARTAFAERFDAPTFDDHTTLLDAADLDALVVTTPNAVHAPAAIAALERDVSVLVEKPLADTLAAARTIADAAAASEAFCMVGFHNRFCAGADLFRELRERGRFGEVTHVDARYLRRRGIPAVGSWFTSADLAGGGALVDIGVHALDLALSLLEFPTVESVSGVTRTAFGDRPDYADPDDYGAKWEQDGTAFDVEDSATALLRCEGDRTIALDVAWATNRDGRKELTVDGTEAGATLEIGGNSLSLSEAGTAPLDHYADTEYSASPDVTGHRAEDEYFLECVEAGESPDRNTVEQGLAVQRVLDAIYRSAASGSAVEL